MSDTFASPIQVAKIAAELNKHWRAKVDEAVAAERARCAEIVKRHLAPMTHDRAAILYDIEEGGSDAEAKHDGE